ncbi:MAG TPA: hypothetical protein VFG41_00085 [Sphingomicrobium sp.]|jgi:uncharacterized protein (DUF2384 family)|nr:hypothetical protein [Sphingomicrobium sp.]
MSPPEQADRPTANPGGRQTMTFRKRSRSPAQTPEQSARQSNIVQSAWRHFGEAELAIAFLNSRHDALDAHPLHLAIESDEGFERVQKVLDQLGREA